MQKYTLFVVAFVCLIPIHAFALSTPPSEKETAIKKITQLPFEVHKKLILVKATVDGKSGYFILDSGASHLYLNRRYFNTRNKPNARMFAKGIHGMDVNLQIYIAKRFEWGGMKLKKIRAYTNDLQHLEAVLEKKILGLIGYNVLKHYELLINYHTLALTIFRLDKKGSHPFQQELHPSATAMSFKMSRHFPVVEGKIGGRKVRFGLDTGASICFLDKRLMKRFTNDMELTASSNITGVTTSKQQIQRANINQINIDFLQFNNIPVAFSSMTHIRNDYQAYIDGLLGYDFFSNKPIAINYKKKKLYIWHTSLPLVR